MGWVTAALQTHVTRAQHLIKPPGWALSGKPAGPEHQVPSDRFGRRVLLPNASQPNSTARGERYVSTRPCQVSLSRGVSKDGRESVSLWTVRKQKACSLLTVWATARTQSRVLPLTPPPESPACLAFQHPTGSTPEGSGSPSVPTAPGTQLPPRKPGRGCDTLSLPPEMRSLVCTQTICGGLTCSRLVFRTPPSWRSTPLYRALHTFHGRYYFLLTPQRIGRSPRKGWYRNCSCGAPWGDKFLMIHVSRQTSVPQGSHSRNFSQPFYSKK